MSDSYDDYEVKMALAEQAWEVKTEHDRAVELAKAYERGWNAALAAVIAIVNDHSDSDGVCCTDDLLAAIRARGEQ